MIGRRDFLALVAGAAAAAGVPRVRAQSPGAAAKIGYIDTAGSERWFEAFRSGLRDLGYVEGQTVEIERRSGAARLEGLPDLAAELIRLQPEVIVVSGPPAALAATRGTTTIPIVLANAGDPVSLGLVANLARPGGNVTGLSNQSTGLGGKRLQLLAEIVPGLTRVGIVWHRGSGGAEVVLREMRTAAAALRLVIEPIAVAQPEDFEAAFEAARAHTDGVAVLNSPVVVRYREFVVAAAARHRVPAIFYDTQFVKAGGLMSYGPDFVDLHRRAAVYVDRIIKGAKPGDLPVEQASKFELTVNLAAARALGLLVPQSILVRADEVIE